jgi:hypothetical protein
MSQYYYYYERAPLESGPGGAEPGGAAPGGADTGGAAPGGADTGGAAPGGAAELNVSKLIDFGPRDIFVL